MKSKQNRLQPSAIFYRTCAGVLTLLKEVHYFCFACPLKWFYSALLCRGYTHRFPSLSCCPMSPSLPRFKNLVRENRTECACSLLPIFSNEVFCLPAKRRPSEPRTRKSNASSDVSDFFAREAWTTPWTRKSVSVATALRDVVMRLVKIMSISWPI